MHLRKNNDRTLYAILLVFLAPIVLAHLLYNSGYGKLQYRTRGTLLTPPIAVTKQKNDYWQIASLESTTHNQQKYQTLEKRWLALGKDNQRVHLSVIATRPTEQQISSAWETLLVHNSTLLTLREMKSKNAKACTLFIINPDNHAVMCYDEQNDLRDIDFDLRKLLKLSRI